MPATRTSSKPAEIMPAQCRDKIISILAAGLVRLIRASRPLGEESSEPSAEFSASGEKLSESGESGLELSGETRLSVPAG